MKVVHVIPTLSIGGAEIVASSLAAGLWERQANISVITLYPSNGSRLEHFLIEKRVPLYHLRKHIGADAGCVAELWRWLTFLQPTIVHSHLRALYYVFPWLLANPSVLAYHTVHTMAETEVSKGLRQLHRVAFRFRVRPVAVAPAVSCSIRSTYGLDRCYEVSNGITVTDDTEPWDTKARVREELGLPEDAMVLVCVARMSVEKNLRALLDIFDRIADELPRVHLLLVGDGPDAEHVAAHAGRLRSKKRVKLLGLRDDVDRLLRASDVFVLCSLKEGNPLVVMEAMSAGLAVVCYAVGGVPDLVHDGVTGLLVRPGDEAGVVAALHRVCSSVDLRKSLGAAARIKALRCFSVGSMVEQYAQLYNASAF